MKKQVWVSKEEWHTNPSLDSCKSRIEVPPEHLRLHPDDYFCFEVEVDVPPPLVKKVAPKEDWLTSDLSLGVVIGMFASCVLFLMFHFAIKLLK